MKSLPYTDAEIARSQDRIAAVLGPEEVKILNLEAELVQLKLERFRLRELVGFGLGLAESMVMIGHGTAGPYTKAFIANAKKELGL